MKRFRLRVHYSGHVQGVGFRYTARTVARGFEINGVIRNLTDGRVELIAEGETKEELTAFHTAIVESGLGSLIRQSQLDWSEATGEFRGFAIGH
jgi:acylphosphatase